MSSFKSSNLIVLFVLITLIATIGIPSNNALTFPDENLKTEIDPPQYLINVTLSTVVNESLNLMEYSVTLDPIFDDFITNVYIYFDLPGEPASDYYLVKLPKNMTTGEFSGVVNPGSDIPDGDLVLKYVYIYDNELLQFYRLNLENVLFDNKYTTGRANTVDLPILNNYTLNASELHYSEKLFFQANVSNPETISHVQINVNHERGSTSYATSFDSDTGLYSKTFEFDEYSKSTFQISEILVVTNSGLYVDFDTNEGFTYPEVKITGVNTSLPDITEFSFNTTSASYSDGVKISMNTTKSLILTQIELKDTANGLPEYTLWLDYNSTSNLYEGEFNITNQYHANELFVDKVLAQNLDDMRTTFEYTSSDYDFPSLSIEGTSPDLSAPQFNDISLNSTQAGITDIVELRLNATDNIELQMPLRVTLNSSEPLNSNQLPVFTIDPATGKNVFRPLLLAMGNYYNGYNLIDTWPRSVTTSTISLKDVNGNQIEVDDQSVSLDIIYPDEWIKVIEPPKETPRTVETIIASEDPTKPIWGFLNFSSLNMMISSVIVITFLVRRRNTH